MNEDEFDDLLRKYLDNSINDQELDIFLNHISAFDNDIIIKKIDRIMEMEDARKAMSLIPLTKHKKRKSQRAKGYAIAASLALLITFGLFWGRSMWTGDNNRATVPANDILMSDSEIVIRNSNGEVKLLDQIDSVYRLGAWEINVDDAGQISYALNKSQTDINDEITIHVPKGKTSFLQLSDSSKVWLNSNSELSFKAHFEKKSRMVSLTGEAYFEVEHDEDRPFIIHTESHDIEVLGTTFNVSSYAGMTAKTTLIDGSVRIKHKSQESILKPLQQFSVATDGQTQLTEVDTSDVLAWREGRFVFDRMYLKDILAYLSNWYPIGDIEVEQWTDDIFTGTFEQDRSLKNILDKLAKTSSYEFQINNGTLEISINNKN